MPTFRINSTAVSPGEYEVEVVNAKEQVSRNGNDMIVLKLRVAGSTRLFNDYLVFTDASDWKIAQFLTAIGQELTDDTEIDAVDFIRRRARALVGAEKVNGRLQNKIEMWLPPSISSADSAIETAIIPPKEVS